MLQIETGAAIEHLEAIIARTAQTEQIRSRTAYIILAAVDGVVLVMMMLEMTAQMPAEQLQQAARSGQLLAARATFRLLGLLVAQIHGGAAGAVAARIGVGARLGAIVG